MDWKELNSHINEWVPIGKLKILSRHVVGDCAAMFAFFLCGKFAEWLFDCTPVIFYLHLLEYFGVITILIYLLYELLKEVIKSGNETHKSFFSMAS